MQTRTDGAAHDPGGAQLLYRSLAVLEAIASAPAPPTASWIAAATDLPRSTVYRIVQAYESRGYLQRIQGRLYPGAAWSVYARAFDARARSVVAEAPASLLRTLSRRLDATTVMSFPSGTRGVLVLRCADRHNTFTSVPTGDFFPLVAGAMGKSLLAYSDTSVQNVAVRLGRQQLLASGRRVDSAALINELRTIRTTGYAASADELQVGTMGVFAPVFLGTTLLANVGVVVPRKDPRAFASSAVVDAVLSAAKDLHHVLASDPTYAGRSGRRLVVTEGAESPPD